MPRPARQRPTRSVVAITGTREFLGAGLVARFERDPFCSAVLALDAPAGSESSPKVHAFEIDLARPGADAHVAEVLREHGAGAMIHAAFCPAPTHEVETMHELESIGTLNVLSACERTVERLVLWSQTILYGARPDNPALLAETWPLRALPESPFLRDKLAAERQVADFAARFPGVRVAVLRTAPIVGPQAVGVIPSLVRRRFVPVAAGFDPLMQVLHEYDAYDAFKLAVDADHDGAFNVVAEGVLPVTTALLVAGRVPLPVPPAVLRRLLSVLWTLRAAETSGPFVDYLLYPCVADGRRAARELGFRPTYSTHEALGDYAARAGTVRPSDDDAAAAGEG
ncbi:MAG: NAD-dependent epimerase/dehydratase family protein [Deltaproteobacteria bacterium]|nr:NAD-dependent epimerase/dehydratase family protein [Deltaproteobacteria bacterium]